MRNYAVRFAVENALFQLRYLFDLTLCLNLIPFKRQAMISDDDDPLDSDNDDFYDDATNTCGFEEWTELFGDSNSDDSTCFEGFE